MQVYVPFKVWLEAAVYLRGKYRSMARLWTKALRELGVLHAGHGAGRVAY